MADWSKLPHDIIPLIATRLHAVEDFLAFSAVCQSWRSVYLTKIWTSGPQIPWLMLSDNQNNNTRSFFSLYRNKVYEFEIPEAHGKRCWGSLHGWLVTTGSDLEVHIINAFTRIRLRLPPQTAFEIQFFTVRDWYKFIAKAIVIKKPRAIEEELLVMAIYGSFNHLAFSGPGYSSWVNVENSSNFRFIDVVCFKGQIYALCDMGTLVVVDIDGPGPPRAVYIASPPHQWAWEQLYLVESSGDLLMVYRYECVGLPGYSVEPIQFEVYKFDMNTKEWIKMDDLGNCALFVGDNYSMSVLAPDAVNCKCNSIYFIGDTVEHWWRYEENFRGHDVGMYNLADGTVEPFYFGADYPSYYSCPIWVMPTLC